MEGEEAVVSTTTNESAPTGSEDVSDNSMKALWARAQKKADEAEAKAKAKRPEDGRVERRQKKPAAKAEETPVEEEEEQAAAPEATDEPEEVDEAQKKADYDTLRQLAKKLGLKVEDDAVTIGERAQFRKERRERMERLDRKEKEINDRLSAAAANLEKKYGAAMEADALLKRADPDEIAKKLGFRSFGEWTQEHVVAGNNPDRRKLRELEAQLNAQREEAEAHKRRLQEHAQAQEAAARQESYLDEVGAKLAEMEGFEDLAEDRDFHLEVLNVQRRHYDKATRTTISTEDAAREVLDNLKKAYETLNKRFGARVSPEQSPPQRRVPRTVSNAHSADAYGSGGKPVPLTREEEQAEEKAWRDKWAKALQNS